MDLKKLRRFITDPATGRVYPIPAGGEGEGEGGSGEGGGGGGSGDDPPEPPKTFTQSEVTAIAAREKAEGKRAAEAAVAESLGVSLDEAKTIIEKARAAEESQKTEAQRAREAADREKREAEEAKRQAAEERHAARVERLLVRKGIMESKKLARVIRLVDVEVGASEEDVTAAIDQLEEDMPELFAKADPEEDKGKKKKRRAPGSDPGGSPPKPKVDKTAYDRGLERAKERSTTKAIIGIKE